MSLIICGSQYAALLNVKALLKDRSSFFQSRCAPHLQGAGTRFAVASCALAAAKEIARGGNFRRMHLMLGLAIVSSKRVCGRNAHRLYGPLPSRIVF